MVKLALDVLTHVLPTLKMFLDVLLIVASFTWRLNNRETLRSCNPDSRDPC